MASGHARPQYRLARELQGENPMIQLAILGILSVWAVVQNLYYWNYLPERVAIHFDMKWPAQ